MLKSARSQAQRAYLNARFGHEWVKRHHFDNKGKLPEHVRNEDTIVEAHVVGIEPGARNELTRFWTVHPDLRQECKNKYGFDPVNDEMDYWKWGLGEPEHTDVRERVEANNGVFTLQEVKAWELEELAAAAAEDYEAGEGVPAWAHYRKAAEPAVRCSTCDYFYNGDCMMFNTPVGADMTCDEWDGPVMKQGPQHTAEPAHRPLEGEDAMRMAELVHALEPMRKTATGALYLVSHAKTRYNKPGQPHDIVHGWKNTPLDGQGQVQARRLGKFLSNRGIEAIHTSDLQRAKQTAQIIGRVADAPVRPSGKFRPWNLGDFAGHSSADVIPQLKPYMKKDADKPVDGGESFNQFKDRFLPNLERLLKQAQAGKTIALVTHSRNIELAQGWLGGKGYRTKVDTEAISEDKLDPATVFEVAPGRGGKWAMTQLTTETVRKGTARPAELNLRVGGVTRHASGDLVYRMETRDGHYVGRTNPTKVRAKKGDILTVQANDFMQDAAGDAHWVNPNVVSHYKDSAHSWRELCAIAGGSLVKEGAPGAAGDIPAAGDVGSPGMPSKDTLAALGPAYWNGSGPTLGDVHVNRPLPNISVAYAGRPKKLAVKKADRAKQLIYGVVLEPNSLDSQDDFMYPEQVEKAAHTYMKKVARGKATVSKLQHTTRGFFKGKPSVVPVESFIAPVDFSYDGKEMVKKGTWVMVLHAEDENVWSDVLSGKYTGLSIGGTGIRQDMRIPSETVPHEWMVSEPTWASTGGVNRP